MIWDYCAKGKWFAKNITSSKVNFTIKAIGVYKNTFRNIYFWEDCNAYFWTNLWYFSLSVVNSYDASILVEDKNIKI